MIVVGIVVLLCAALANGDLYSDLGVSRAASVTDVRKSFRRLSRQLHPDVTDDPNAKEKFAQVLKAYNVLSDPSKRAKYDQFGDEDDQQARPRPRSPFEPFFGRQHFKHIDSVTRTLSFTDLIVDVLPVVCAKVRLIQVYADQSGESQMFAHAWEALAKSSVGRSVELLRVDFADQMVQDAIGAYVSSLPTILAVVNGQIMPMRDVRISQSISIMTVPVKSFVDSIFQDSIKELRANSIASSGDLSAAVYRHRYRPTLVVVNVDDANFEALAPQLLSMSDELVLRGVRLPVLTEWSEKCQVSRIKTTSVWVFNTFDTNVCGGAKYPSGRLLDEEGIARFVDKRKEKPVPVLTNASFSRLCLEETPCVVDLRSAVKPSLSPLLGDVIRSQVVNHVVIDADDSPQTARLSDPGAVRAVIFSEEGYASVSGALGDVRQFIARLERSDVTLQRLPGWWYLEPHRLEYSTWRSSMTQLESLYASIPMANVLMLGVIWYAMNWICGHRPAVPRPPQPPPAPAPSSSSGTRSRPTDTTPRRDVPPRPQSQSPQPTSPGTASGGSASRTYPGPSGSHETARKSISALALDDAENAETRVLLVLLFSPCEGVKAPPDAAKLLHYHDVRIRAVPQRYVGWWSWLQRTCPELLRECAESKTPVVVAVRAKRGTAAVKPLERPLQMWVDEIMEGCTPLDHKVDVPAWTRV
jgi:hypothetical protein